MWSELPCSVRDSTAAAAVRPGPCRCRGIGLVTCTQASTCSMAVSLSGVTSDNSTCHQRLHQRYEGPGLPCMVPLLATG